MSKASYISQPTIQRIPVLLQEIRDGALVIPKFQRPFVWTDQQRVELMESIYTGIPIGSLLVWRTHDQGLPTYRLRGIKIRPDEDKDKGRQRQYIIDGHQRVITLFTALGPGLVPDEDDKDVPLVADDDDYRQIPAIYFDLENKAFVLEPKRGPPGATWLPLRDLFNDLRLYDFLETLAKHTIKGKDRETLVNRARILHRTFYDYSIAVVPIIADDLDLITTSFERVNSAGTPLSQVHMVSALTYIKGFDLNQRVQEIRDELADVGWQELDEEMILNVCKLRLGVHRYLKDMAALVTALKKNHALLEQASEALVLAATFLARECAIHGPQTLPYSYQIVMLADVLWSHKDNTGDLDEPLATWLWATSYAEYFASMSSSRIAAALEHLRGVAAGKANPIPPDLPTEITPPRQRFDFRAARSRVMALTMADMEPVSPRKKAYDAHMLLAEHGRHAMPKLLSSREAGARASEGFENRFLASPRDSKALRDALRTPGKLTPKQLASHGITRPAATALHKGRHDEFLRLRRDYFLDVERDVVESLGLTYIMDE